TALQHPRSLVGPRLEFGPGDLTLDAIGIDVDERQPVRVAGGEGGQSLGVWNQVRHRSNALDAVWGSVMIQASRRPACDIDNEQARCRLARRLGGRLVEPNVPNTSPPPRHHQCDRRPLSWSNALTMS